VPKVTPLKIAIVASGMTQAEIAERIGRTRDDVSRWANDTPGRPLRGDTKIALASVLGKTVDELWPDESQDAEPQTQPQEQAA
jgi:transcriptional regulator with XRE-family HTH domain